MAAKTLEQFYKEYCTGFNIITGEPNLFKDLTDEHVWNAAIKSVVENGIAKLCPHHFRNEQCIWGLRGCCSDTACSVQLELRK
jgi:hypothetical protein